MGFSAGGHMAPMMSTQFDDGNPAATGAFNDYPSICGGKSYLAYREDLLFSLPVFIRYLYCFYENTNVYKQLHNKFCFIFQPNWIESIPTIVISTTQKRHALKYRK
jgi:acetyl esterase/lipase